MIWLQQHAIKLASFERYKAKKQKSDLLDITVAEQELAVQIALLDDVHVGHADGGLPVGGYTHQRPVLMRAGEEGNGGEKQTVHREMVVKSRQFIGQ
jgi:hypothetical protein